ncbi:TIR domain-containing protein [Qipengyuania aurantiaca]|uniref:TIR domain-containing protein n=1 Tax=Qipengyuania aurantiaca TaxID=2867233 RepID=A0ABX8ZPT6_9SPHN|nr:TIR domain-containing protein [Qipengyuania aurantiaca]QZD91010.1 TIR domain-containing protein [Qipengyuania aurantiaca]
MADRRYRAFISYSHRDKRIANWLHRALETYRLPPHLVEGGKPARLHPIFKDRDELPAADSLGAAIEQAIASSDALIVLCSPDAAASPWIAREVDLYKRLNGDRNVFPVIVEGEPPDNFPPPLLQHYEEGAPTGETSEPIAADLRVEGDGKKLGKLKLVAGLAGVDLDGLVQRDAARRQRRLAGVAALSLLGMVGTSALALYAIDQRDEARDQRAEADGLIEYMLTDLREQLEPVGRLEVLDGVGQRAMEYYTRQKLEDLSDSELGRRARATLLVAEVANMRGDNENALPAFRQAARSTAAILERNPEDSEALFNHGQSVFWVGAVAFDRGEMPAARAAMEEYHEISARLAARDRTNLDWQMEEAFSLNNLAMVLSNEGKYTEAVPLFREYTDIVRRVAEAKGNTAADQAEVALALDSLATAQRRIGEIDEAIATFRSAIGHYEEILRKDPQDQVALRGLGYAKGRLAQAYSSVGSRRESLATFKSAIEVLERAHAVDPEAATPLNMLANTARSQGAELWRQGQPQAAAASFDRADALSRELAGRDPDSRAWAVIEPSELELLRYLTDRQDAPADERLSAARRVIARLNPEDDIELTGIVLAYWLAAKTHRERGETRAAEKALASIVALAPDDPTQLRSETTTRLIALAAARTGAREKRKAFADYVRRAGLDPPIT